jgi:hypothetical protein
LESYPFSLVNLPRVGGIIRVRYNSKSSREFKQAELAMLALQKVYWQQFIGLELPSLKPLIISPNLWNKVAATDVDQACHFLTILQSKVLESIHGLDHDSAAVIQSCIVAKCIQYRKRITLSVNENSEQGQQLSADALQNKISCLFTTTSM